MAKEGDWGKKSGSEPSICLHTALIDLGVNQTGSSFYSANLNSVQSKQIQGERAERDPPASLPITDERSDISNKSISGKGRQGRTARRPAPMTG